MDPGGYLESRLSEQEKILALYLQDRRDNKFLKRDLYHRVESKLDQFLNEGAEQRWLVIPGLRGSGKTTTLAQIYFQYEKKFGKRILYLSLDEIKSKLNFNLYTMLDAYEDLLKTSYQNLEQPVLLLLDEVHYDPDWALALKNLYDKSRNVFIISTGSSAISLNMNADVLRRSLTMHSHPLSFLEYIYITQQSSWTYKQLSALSQSIYEALFESDNLRDSYNELLKLETAVLQVHQDLDKFTLLKFLQLYSLPSVLSLQDETEIYQQLNMIVRRIISHDLSSIKTYSSEVMSKIENLLFLLASSDTVSLHTLSANLGININTLSSILDTLLQAQLLIKVPAYGSATKKARKPAKYLFLAPALRSALVSIMGSSLVNRAKGKALEDFVFGTYKRFTGQTNLIQLSYDSSKSGADLIYQSPLINYVMEIGWNKRSSAQILETMKRSQIDSGILLSQTGLDYNSKEQVLKLALEYFALL